jgi:glycerol dehydrogenase-like iron-containing ADH family enzyme
MEEARAADVIAGLGPTTIVANDPPWSALKDRIPEPVRHVPAWNMDLTHLQSIVAEEPDASDVVVGIGGGTAMDTAKFIAHHTGKRLVQVPSIMSVDAAWTELVGIRDAGRVRYVAPSEPELVVLDVGLLQTAPKRLNRTGLGDVLSCHTGLFDWRLATAAGQGPPWREDLAELGRTFLAEIDAATEELRAVTDDALRLLARQYQRMGAAIAEAGHPRFEEGSEHFWAYAYEHATGAHQVHGELVCLGVTLISHLQDNDPVHARDLVVRTGVRAHPADLGITEPELTGALVGLRAYSRAEGLEYGIADAREITPADAAEAWTVACSLPRIEVDE